MTEAHDFIHSLVFPTHTTSEEFNKPGMVRIIGFVTSSVIYS